MGFVMEPSKKIEGSAIKPVFITSAQELIDNDITEIPWLWDKFIPYRCLTFVSGDSDTGKSTLLRQLSFAIVSGEREYLGQSLRQKHKNVVYVSTEDDILSLSPRMKKEKDYFSSDVEYSNLRFIFEDEDILRKLREALSYQSADLVILDSFGDLYQGDINSSSETRNFMKGFKTFAEQYSCAVVFLHHNRKAAASGNPNKHDLLGSMAIEAKGRSVLMVAQGDSRTDRRTLKIAKGNYVTPEEKRKEYELSFTDGIFELANVQSNYASTSTDPELKELVYKYRIDGYTVRDIAQALKESGYDISKSSVSRILNA